MLRILRDIHWYIGVGFFKAMSFYQQNMVIIWRMLKWNSNCLFYHNYHWMRLMHFLERIWRNSSPWYSSGWEQKLRDFISSILHGGMSHARLFMQSIYSLKISLLSKQLDNIYTKEQLSQVNHVAQFVGLFHAVWYFKCPLARSAPMLHLTTISQMKRLG